MHPWVVGTPGMSSIVRPLAESVRVSTGKRVHTLERRDKGWHVWFEDETSVGPFQAVAVAVPAAEARLLLGRIEELVAPLSRVRMMPCWALMVRIEEKTLPDQDVFSDMSEVVRWVARNNTKPGRNPGGENIVIHASPAWSRERGRRRSGSGRRRALERGQSCLEPAAGPTVAHDRASLAPRPCRPDSRRDVPLLLGAQGGHRRRLVPRPACRTRIRKRRPTGTRHHRIL